MFNSAEVRWLWREIFQLCQSSEVCLGSSSCCRMNPPPHRSNHRVEHVSETWSGASPRSGWGQIWKQPDLNLPTTIFHCGFEPLMSFSAVDTHWPTFYKELVLELQAQPPYKDLVQQWFERFSLQSTIWPLPLHFWILKPSDYFRVYVTNKRLLMRPQTVGLCCVRAQYINYSNHKKRLTLTTKSGRPCNHFWKLVLSLNGAIKDFIFIIMGIKSWTMLDRIIVTWDFYIVP